MSSCMCATSSHADTEAQAEDVNRVLDELGIDEVRRGQIIEVWNKLDLLTPEERAAREAQAQRKPDCVLVSALSRARGWDTCWSPSRTGSAQPTLSTRSFSTPPTARARPGSMTAARYWSARTIRMAACGLPSA